MSVERVVRGEDCVGGDCNEDESVGVSNYHLVVLLARDQVRDCTLSVSIEMLSDMV